MPSNWMSQMMASGRCCACGQPAQTDRSRCSLCLEKGRAKAKETRLRQKLAGLCMVNGCKGRPENGVLCALHRQIGLERTKQYEHRRKCEAFRRYGGAVCACCGEWRLEFLTIDHINGGGNRHRRECKIGKMHLWLKRNAYPPGFQVLCFNCNHGNGSGKVCPHHRYAHEASQQEFCI